jgi:pimeloyl-ACP methyl ester carboxylesterase
MCHDENPGDHMADAAETYVTVCDCRTFIRRGGAGEPVLFLHGAGGLPGWQPFHARLAERYDVFAPDHPGYGQSDNPGWLEEVADLAQFYLEFLKSCDLRGVHLIGHSLGGWIALEMATRSTARIKSLTLLSAAGIRVKDMGPPDIFAMDQEELLRTLFHDRALIEQQLAATPGPEQLAAMARNRVTAARLGWNPRFCNPKLRKWLRKIDIPTHIIWGDQDRIFAPVYANELQNEIAGSKVTMIPDTGHMLHVEKADAVADAVLGFAH